MPPRVTGVAADDVLTSIYRMSRDEGITVIAAHIAERQEVSAASISAMLRRLEKAGLIQMGARRQVLLTEIGLAQAERMIRRHRLAECLLINVLQLEWWRGFEEAHLVEHAISDVTEPLIAAFLGRPQRSPFGFPIPGIAQDADEILPRATDLRAGEHAIVSRIFEEDSELLRFFADHGVRPGAHLAVLRASTTLGTTTMAIGDQQVTISLVAASRIWVSPA